VILHLEFQLGTYNLILRNVVLLIGTLELKMGVRFIKEECTISFAITVIHMLQNV
jgi:hypothetical protein